MKTMNQQIITEVFLKYINNMKNFLKKLIYKITAPDHNKLTENISELLWANIYHDTARGKKWIKDLSISPYDMAINYSMLYLLTRVLCEFKISSVLEFGLGQSSKFINSYFEANNFLSNHHIIEHNEEWIHFFSRNISTKSTIKKLKLMEKKLENFSVQLYENLSSHIASKYDLYLIDGPNGLPSFSRFDICILAEKFTKGDQFIIIMDDYQRKGEQGTIEKLKTILENNNIKFQCKVFQGSKAQFLIVTDRYKFATSF